jgi:hypothetical protein
MYVALNDSVRPELTFRRNISLQFIFSPLFPAHFRLRTCKRTCKLYRPERILIKQKTYKTETEAFAVKCDKTLFQEKNLRNYNRKYTISKF